MSKKKFLLGVGLVFLTVSLIAAEKTVKSKKVNSVNDPTMFGLNLAVPKYSTAKTVYGFNFGVPATFNLYNINGFDFGGMFSCADNVNGMQISLFFNMNNLMNILQKIIKLKEKEAFAKDQSEIKLIDKSQSNVSDEEGVKLNSIESNIDKVREYIPKWLDMKRKYKASINGIQISLLLNMSKHMNGAQISFTNIVTNSSNGLQTGLVNIGDKNFEGLQISAFNNLIISGDGIQISALANNTEEFNGCQISLFNNSNKSLNGLQIGLTNASGQVSGLQIGLYNTSENGSGLQIGLINYMKNSLIPYFPIINFGY